ncbi:MAG TPA: FtsQ-type POTRA domain-containing protein [Polyangiales bacterium]
MARSDKPKAPENRRTTPPPENRRSAPATPRVPLSVRLVVWRERVRVRLSWLRRVGSVAAGVVVVTAASAGLYCVGTLVQRHLRTSPAFATKVIEVHGASHLTHDDVAHAAGLVLGQNVFQVSPEQARAQLLQDPWVATATVHRRLPATYYIELSERRPIALLALDDLYLVGDDGAAFKKLGPGDPADFPLITGIDPEQVQRDKHGAVAVLLGAVSLLSDYQDAGLSRREPISEIHAEDDGSLALYVGGDATYVRLGKAPFRSKLSRLRLVLSELSNKRSRAAYVYLDNERRPDRVTVRLR